MNQGSIKSHLKGLAKYEANPRYCLCCEKLFSYEEYRRSRTRKFCSRSCSATYNNLLRGPVINSQKLKTSQTLLKLHHSSEIYKIKFEKAKLRFSKNEIQVEDIPQEYSCLTCGYLVLYNKKYCSAVCRDDYEEYQNLIQWKMGLRSGISGKKNFGVAGWLKKYLKDKFNNQCSQCGWNKVNPFTNLVPLEVEHIDGDCTNNKEDNLTLLCPCCHALTGTYKSLNKGKSKRK